MVTLFGAQGAPIKPTQELVLVTSDYLAYGGDELFSGIVAAERFEFAKARLRDALARGLKQHHDLRAKNFLGPQIATFATRPLNCKKSDPPGDSPR